MKSLVTQHRAGSADYSELLWGILNLQIWRRTFGL